MDAPADLEGELEANFLAGASPAKIFIANAPDALVEAVLGGDHLVHLVLSFLSVSHESIGAVSRAFDRVHQTGLRKQCRGLLEVVLPLHVAAQVESALHAGCGGRAGPGAYNSRVRRMLLNLRSNEDLRRLLVDGSQSPSSFVSMRVDAMATSAQVARVQQLEAEAVEAARKRAPPADVTGLWQCQACGCTKQWLKRFVRAGDVTKYSEVLTCCECKAQVDPRGEGDLWVGTGVGVGAGGVGRTRARCPALPEGGEG